MTKPMNASLVMVASSVAAPQSCAATCPCSAGTMTTPNAAAMAKRTSPGMSWLLNSGRTRNMARMRGWVSASVAMNDWACS